MQAALAQLSQEAGGQVALATLQTILSNILAHQEEPKYRKLRLENAAMQKKVFSISGGTDFLLAVGFKKTETDLILPNSVSPVSLVQARQAIEDALKSTAPPAVAAAAPPAAAPAPPAAAPAPPAAPAAPAAPAMFSADSIASMLNNIQPAAAAPPAAPPAAGSFSADSIASMLRNMPSQPQQQQRGAPPLDLMEVLSLANPWDGEMQAKLADFLPDPQGSTPDSVAETLSTPQLQQAAASFTHALNGLGGQGLIAEMRLNPSGYGVEPFLRSLQEKADAEKRAKEAEQGSSASGGGASASSAQMDLS